jgi:hypothetical protein
MIIFDYYPYLMSNNYQIMDILFDDYFYAYLAPLIPIIQIMKSKFEYPNQIIMTYYLMIMS